MQIPRSVALVGRPNVGKSRLFNRLVGKRISIVHDEPGVTRDLVMEEGAEGIFFMDTGGIGMEIQSTPVAIVNAVEEQVDFAMEAAALILFLVDGRVGCTALDEKIAEQLRSYGKKIFLVVNKVDRPSQEVALDEFYRLGFAVLAVSAEHGLGMDALWERIRAELGPREEKLPKVTERIKMGFVGRPNVGKSSLCNRLLHAKRLVVSESAGTTRDTVTVDFNYVDGEETHAFQLLDTAGMRPTSKVGSSVEYFSTVRTRRAMEEADVIFLVLEALSGVTEQDKKLALQVLERGTALGVVVNKWDQVEELFAKDPLEDYEDEESFYLAFKKAVKKAFLFLPNVPIIFTSAKSERGRGQTGMEEIIKKAIALVERQKISLSTSKINRVMASLIEKVPPKRGSSGKLFKIYYCLQVGNRPLRIRVYCNESRSLGKEYQRYLQKGLRAAFSLEGCPLVFQWVSKTRRA